MKEYVHGGDIYSQEIELDFSANINPFGLPEGVKKKNNRENKYLFQVSGQSKPGFKRKAGGDLESKP